MVLKLEFLMKNSEFPTPGFSSFYLKTKCHRKYPQRTPKWNTIHSRKSFLNLAKPSHYCHLFSTLSKALDGTNLFFLEKKARRNQFAKKHSLSTLKCRNSVVGISLLAVWPEEVNINLSHVNSILTLWSRNNCLHLSSTDQKQPGLEQTRADSRKWQLPLRVI